MQSSEGVWFASQVGQRSALVLGLVEGALACMACRHALQPLVAYPAWVMTACAAFLALPLLWGPTRARTFLAIGAGAAIALAVPRTVSPPLARVMTHAIPHARGVDLFDALQRLDDDPSAVIGSRIRVTGLWHPGTSHAPASVYRTVVACCAADAIEVGFDVASVSRVNLSAGTAVRVTGVVGAVEEEGDVRYRLNAARVVACPLSC